MKCGAYILVKHPPLSHSQVEILLQLFSSEHTINNKVLSLNQIMSRNPKTVYESVEAEDTSIASMIQSDVSTVIFPCKLRLSITSCSHEYAISVYSKGRKAWMKICHILAVLVICLNCTYLPCNTQSVAVRQVILEIRDTSLAYKFLSL